MKSLSVRGNWQLTLCLAAVGLGYLYFAFLPAKAEIQRLLTDLKAKQADVTQGQRLKLTIHEIELDLATTHEYLDRWKPQWNVDAASVLAQISNQAERAGVRTVRFDPQATVPFQTMKRTQLVLGTEGSFTGLFKMLRSIEDVNAVIWVDELKISTASDEEGALSSEVSLAIFADNPEISD